MPQETKQQFSQGLNDRLPDDRGDKFRKLQNVRLNERGKTLQASRIEGYEYIAGSSTTFDVVYDTLFYDNDLVVYWYDTSTSQVKITFIDVDSGSETQLSFSESQADYGELTLLEDNIYITPYNKQLNNVAGTWRISDFKSTTPTFDIGFNSTNSTLDDLTYYWYKLRFVYYDGHKTITSYPQFVETASPAKEVEISNINIQDDLDGNLADIEVFRKKEGQDWFLIERYTPSSKSDTYTDDGKVSLQPLDERNYVWADNPKSQDIVRDRLVRANLEYSDKELGWEEGDVQLGKITASGTIDFDILPKNTEVEIFAQGKFKDGTITPHKKLGEISVADETTQLKTDPQTQPSNVDDLNEVAYYAKYKSKTPTNLTFNSLEIYNSNIPSLATKNEAEADQDKPINPHIFLGYKYIRILETISVVDQAITSVKNEYVIDEDWDTSGTDDSTNVTDDKVEFNLSIPEITTLPFYQDPPEILTVDIHGVSLKYKIKYQYLQGDSDTDNNSYIYELTWVEPLKRAISEGKASVKLVDVLNNDSLSSLHTNDDYIDNEVDIVGMLDTSTTRQKAHLADQPNTSSTQIWNTGKNHVYLILDSDSIYSDVNNESINNDGVLGDYDSGQPNLNFDATLQFELVGLSNKDFGDEPTTDNYSQNNNITEYTVDYGLSEFSPLKEDQDELLYLGTQEDFDVDNSTQYFGYFEGYDVFKENLFEYQTLIDASIFEQIILEDSLQHFQENYPNQIVWGGSYILESNASGTRDFEFTNFKNISQDYGEIVRIAYINNVLLVFCERGLNRINIGEVLTQQSSGQVFVDSSSFLNNDQWLLRNVPDMKPKSVRQYENMLFFCDGKDVWRYTNSPENITNGKITLDVDKDYVGHIDPKNKEYLLSDGTNLYAYSIELDEWTGKHTFSPEATAVYRDNYYGVIDNEATKFNVGNDFGGSTFDSIIESVGNTLGDETVTKLYRKFYMNTEGSGTFEYSRDDSDYESVDLSTATQKNGEYHIGIKGKHKNASELYWRLTSSVQDFVLKAVSFLFTPRKRR